MIETHNVHHLLAYGRPGRSNFKVICWCGGMEPYQTSDPLSPMIHEKEAAQWWAYHVRLSRRLQEEANGL